MVRNHVHHGWIGVWPTECGQRIVVDAKGEGFIPDRPVELTVEQARHVLEDLRKALEAVEGPPEPASTGQGGFGWGEGSGRRKRK